jgi:integrase
MPGSVYRRPNKPGGIYWMKFTYRGKRYQTSTMTAKKREAEDLLAFYLGQCARGEFKGFQAASLSMQKVFDDFEKDCQRRKLRGMDIIGYHLKPVRAWFASMDAEHVTEHDISHYIDSRLVQRKRETTVNRELQYLGQAMRLAKRRKLLKEIPYIEKFSEKENARQGFFEEADFERLVSFLPEDLKDFVRFGYLTGWRKGEVARLAWQHVQDDTIRLPPHISKNKNGRVLIVVGQLAEILARRRAVRRDDLPWVFSATWGNPSEVSAARGRRPVNRRDYP